MKKENRYKENRYNVNGHIGKLTETIYEYINMSAKGKRSGWYPCLALLEINTGKWLYSRHWKLSEYKKADKELCSLGYQLQK